MVSYMDALQLFVCSIPTDIYENKLPCLWQVTPHITGGLSVNFKIPFKTKQKIKQKMILGSTRTIVFSKLIWLSRYRHECMDMSAAWEHYLGEPSMRSVAFQLIIKTLHIKNKNRHGIPWAIFDLNHSGAVRAFANNSFTLHIHC